MYSFFSFQGSPLHQSLVLAGMSLSDMEIMEKDTQKLENKDPRLSQEEYDKVHHIYIYI